MNDLAARALAARAPGAFDNLITEHADPDRACAQPPTQNRERAVLCTGCYRFTTWADSGQCGTCEGSGPHGSDRPYSTR